MRAVLAEVAPDARPLQQPLDIRQDLADIHRLLLLLLALVLVLVLLVLVLVLIGRVPSSQVRRLHLHLHDLQLEPRQGLLHARARHPRARARDPRAFPPRAAAAAARPLVAPVGWRHLPLSAQVVVLLLRRQERSGEVVQSEGRREVWGGRSVLQVVRVAVAVAVVWV